MREKYIPLNGEPKPLYTLENNGENMNIFDKLKSLSKPMSLKFDDLPDMVKDKSIEKFDIGAYAKDIVGAIIADAKKVGGFDLEVKVVGVGVRVALVDPSDETRTRIATTSIEVGHPDLNMGELLSTADVLPPSDGNRILHSGDKEDDESTYRPGKYDGVMYG
jgi:hypothetical protein